jgi:NADH dehydrogenase FAD-containing subunit
MIQRDYLIVGGGVGGASVCDSLRQYDTKGSVTLVSNEPFLPGRFRCLLRQTDRKTGRLVQEKGY